MTKALSVDQVGVVLAARVHNPSIINPDFLKANRIVPADWVVKQTITSPGFAQTSFENGVGLIVDENRCVIKEHIAGDFRNTYFAHSIAAAYIKTLPHVPYRQIGLNWLLNLPKRNPKPWLSKRFLKPGNWLKSHPAIAGAAIRFETEFNGSTCFLEISSGESRGQNQEKTSTVIINANFHYEGPFEGAERILEIISASSECQFFLRLATKKLLSGNLT